MAALVRSCKVISLLTILFLLEGCAATVPIAARFPAPYPEAAELREVTVMTFGGRYGVDFTTSLRTALFDTYFDAVPYFTLVGAGRNVVLEGQAAVDYARSEGADGVYFGWVNGVNFSNEDYQEERTICGEGSGLFECKNSRRVTVYCTRRTVRMDVSPNLVNVYNNEIVYSAQQSASTSRSWCEGESWPDNVALIARVRDEIINNIRLDVAPRNAVLQAAIMDSNDGLAEEAEASFDAAVEAMEEGDMLTACRLLEETDEASPNHLSTIYNLGVCAESDGNFAAAINRYRNAQTLSESPNSDVQESIQRVNTLLVAEDALSQSF